jgi:hypothetical protein
LLIKFALFIRLFDASLNPVEKKFQGNMPAKTISAYGAVPSEGKCAIRPKTTVKTSTVKKGRTSAHASPITVCL